MTVLLAHSVGDAGESTAQVRHSEISRLCFFKLSLGHSQFANVTRDFREIIVELMITICQSAHAGARDGFGIQRDTCNRCDFILVAMIQEHRDARWQARGEVRSRLDVLALPPSGADEGRRDRDDRSENARRGVLGQDIDEYRSADRVANDDVAAPKRGDLILECDSSSRKLRIGLVRHDRITHPVALTQLSSKTLDELVVPLLVDILARALDKEGLPHGLSLRLKSQISHSVISCDGLAAQGTDRTNRHDHVAPLVPLLHVAVRLDDLVQRIRPIDDRP